MKYRVVWKVSLINCTLIHFSITFIVCRKNIFLDSINNSDWVKHQLIVVEPKCICLTFLAKHNCKEKGD